MNPERRRALLLLHQQGVTLYKTLEAMRLNAAWLSGDQRAWVPEYQKPDVGTEFMALAVAATEAQKNIHAAMNSKIFAEIRQANEEVKADDQAQANPAANVSFDLENPGR